MDHSDNELKIIFPMATNLSPRTVAIRWFEEVWNQRSVPAIHEMLSADCLGHMEGLKIVGPGQFEAFHQDLLKALPDLRIEVEDTVCEGENVVIRWRFSGKHTGHGLGCAPTHSEVGASGMSWFKVRDGRIVEGWDRWNQAAFMRQLMAVQ